MALTFRLLIVEDDPDHRAIAKMAAESSSRFSMVKLAADGEFALDRLREAVRSGAPLPDMILTDNLMPRLGGFELVKAIKADTELSRIPIAMFSNAGESFIVKAFEIGCAAAFAKTASFSEMKALMAALPERCGLLDSLSEDQRIFTDRLNRQYF